MSRGRGGPSREHYHRHPPPDLQSKENYHRSGPSPHFPRPGPQQAPYSNYYHSPGHPVVPIQPPAPALIPSAPPIPNYNKVAHNSSHQNHGPIPAPNSFHYQQIDFLRGQRFQAPQFRANPRGGGGGVGPSSYQPQSGYSRYPNPNSSPRDRGGYNQDYSFGYSPSIRPPRGTPGGPRHLNQNQLQAKSHNQYPSRQCCGETDSLSENFQSLSLYRDRPNRAGERFDRHSASSSLANSSFNITLTPDVQDHIYRALAFLKPNETISAKLLAKKLRLPKKIVNKALYSLERSQKASKQGIHPPEWALYREEEVQSPPSYLCVSAEHPPEAKVELKTETTENLGQIIEEDSDTESSSSNCSSLESSDSEESQSPGKGQHQEQQHPGTSGSPDQELKLPTMADQKELVLRYLLHSQEATALVIAKNLGLRTTKQVNPTLYALEKQGEIIKNGEVNPPTWELSTRRRERMERSIKAAQSTPAEGVQMEVGPSRDEKGGGSVFLPSPPLPPIAGLEPQPLPEGWMPEQSHSEASETSLQPPSSTSIKEEETNEGQWATDDIPEFLNAIRRETDAGKLAAEKANAVGTVAVSLAAPPPQNLWAKLQEVRMKNPVSGLMEYAQYLGQNCEFLLLDQSGPSHDPRFRMQVMLNGKLFPVAEASSKKVAKKDCRCGHPAHSHGRDAGRGEHRGRGKYCQYGSRYGSTPRHQWVN
ncbi:Double-stranded RNA-specific adenosine deaminase [Larimichthys crocea]|uniref:Uncharacterized protein n=1 Tax=Larimichthys crocea TaxID=215358 RepID=A0ACD3QTM9_LARCR|nr:Double-stranded RNA-specific adenosine deaminase [Larimichthys crocea]